MNEINLNNPAGRLQQILVSLKAVSAGNVRSAFTQVFDINPNDSAAVITRLAGCLRSADEIAERLTETGHSSLLVTYAEVHDRLKMIFSPSEFNGNWNNFSTSNIRDQDIKTLEIYSTLFKTAAPEKTLTTEQLKDLSTQLKDLFESVLSSDLELEFKTLILDGLNNLRRAVGEYQVRGMVGVQGAFAESIGVIVIIEKKAPAQGNAVYQTFKKWVIEWVPVFTGIIQAAPVLEEGAKHFERVKNLLGN